MGVFCYITPFRDVLYCSGIIRHNIILGFYVCVGFGQDLPRKAFIQRKAVLVTSGAVATISSDVLCGNLKEAV